MISLYQTNAVSFREAMALADYIIMYPLGDKQLMHACIAAKASIKMGETPQDIVQRITPLLKKTAAFTYPSHKDNVLRSMCISYALRCALWVQLPEALQLRITVGNIQVINIPAAVDMAPVYEAAGIAPHQKTA